eukprot:TRINITY_DN20192_c0_g1_i1.p1 TRINITY_DN20192_c0_g1~~TRINITY_DN20192_c0_g1_i1.p1  ORF type:complete len:137 (+),score=6.42 TRINITY_DN20192_c0_g1_i1:110-520(+)
MAKEANPILCCTGSFPGNYTLFASLFALMLAMVTAVDPASLRSMRLLQFVSLCTAPLGIWALRKEQRVKNVPRGCDCCCTCPYPAWSLLLQLLDILFGILSMAGGSRYSNHHLQPCQFRLCHTGRRVQRSVAEGIA